MTSNDFFLLLAAFAGFVLAPTLLFWGLARLVNHGKNGGADRGLRSNTEAKLRANNEQDKEAARSEESNASLDRLGSGGARVAPSAALSPY
ncbi:hypothetical protein [Enhydrobacter sp.]|jgi:hypothetical protein|uniref:hypothetical protein n=1 Tax=Enhydrobacter sp. TaxID=1894999 RepID=UPI00261B4137|nr:hypothetical protein [Enhydrobacter sp.]